MWRIHVLSHGTISLASLPQDSDLRLVVGDSLKAEKELASVTEVSRRMRVWWKGLWFLEKMAGCDLDIQAAQTLLLKRLFPHRPSLCPETGSYSPVLLPQLSHNPRTWVLDIVAQSPAPQASVCTLRSSMVALGLPVLR